MLVEMSEEKKEKEKKTISVSIELSTINKQLTEAMNFQREIMQSPIVEQALQVAKVYESFWQMNDTLQCMASINSVIQESQKALQALESSTAGMRAMLEYQTGINKLMEQLGEVSNMVASVKIPEIAIPKLNTELATIPSQNNTLVRSLLREIDLLEKELAKEKTKNKGLIALLDEKRKELKKQYVI
jgi:soluble cytochrome b562